MVWGGGKTDSSIWLDIYYPSKKVFSWSEKETQSNEKCLTWHEQWFSRRVNAAKVLYLII